ncbi:MAG: hypothetical protein PHC75_09555, partial [Burkholderiales bacterium]|nr:hypothetical protein [Burkholderiales bacterium]
TPVYLDDHISYTYDDYNKIDTLNIITNAYSGQDVTLSVNGTNQFFTFSDQQLSHPNIQQIEDDFLRDRELGHNIIVHGINSSKKIISVQKTSTYGVVTCTDPEIQSKLKPGDVVTVHNPYIKGGIATGRVMHNGQIIIKTGKPTLKGGMKSDRFKRPAQVKGTEKVDIPLTTSIPKEIYLPLIEELFNDHTFGKHFAITGSLARILQDASITTNPNDIDFVTADIDYIHFLEEALGKINGVTVNKGNNASTLYVTYKGSVVKIEVITLKFDWSVYPVKINWDTKKGINIIPNTKIRVVDIEYIPKRSISPQLKTE